MVDIVIDLLKEYLTPHLLVFIISMLPVLELRGGLIAASILGIPWYEAAPLAVIANLIPIPFIVLFIERILEFMAAKGPFKKFAASIMTRGRKKGDELLDKYPNSLMIGLYAFVAIPLPGTGAWTGALIAALLGLEPKKTILPIGLGVATACVIMLILAYMIPGMFGVM